MRKDYIELVNLKLAEEKIFSKYPLNEEIDTKKDQVEFVCHNCGLTFTMTIKNLMDPRRKSRACQRCQDLFNFNSRLNSLYGRNPYNFISEFKSYKDPLTVECIDCHDVFTVEHAKILLLNNNLPEGAHPCKKCTELRRFKTYDIIELENTLIEKFGACNYEFPDKDEYSGLYSKKKFRIICKKCNHEMNTLITNILNPSNGEHYCRVCNNKDRLLEKMDYKERCLSTTNGAIEPIDEYIDSKTPIRHKCNICGYGVDVDWLKIPVKNTLRNAGCPVCAGNITTSSAETEILNYIQSIYSGEVVIKNREVLSSKKEIDIYIPELKIGFEINGLYWHSEKYKGKKYHLNKTLEANDDNIRLVHIFEDEWYQKKEICKDKISNIIGKTQSMRVYARKCSIRTDVKPSDKNAFFEKYHIQGRDNASIIVSLEYDQNVVAIMTFAKPRVSLGRKECNDGEYELSRYACSCNVIGGFSKLLKYAIKNFNIKIINTYADIRWSSMKDNVYTKNGFKLVNRSAPGYWYFNKNEPSRSVKRHHRFGFRKQLLKEKFPDLYDPNLTEFEIMDKTNYGRIWDCGNLVYRMEVSNETSKNM